MDTVTLVPSAKWLGTQMTLGREESQAVIEQDTFNGGNTLESITADYFSRK